MALPARQGYRWDSGAALSLWQRQQLHQQLGRRSCEVTKLPHHAGTRMSCLSLSRHGGCSDSPHSRTQYCVNIYSGVGTSHRKSWLLGREVAMTLGYMEAVLHRETLLPAGIGSWLAEAPFPGRGCLQRKKVLSREKKQHLLPTEKLNSLSEFMLTRGERTTLEKGRFRTMEIFQTERE